MTEPASSPTGAARSDVVLDASVAVAALTAVDAHGFALQDRLAVTACHAPHLLGAEVGSVLRRRVAAGAIGAGNAEAALVTLQVLVSQMYPHGPIASAAWAMRANMSYYDALYVALAARLGIPLLTGDARLTRAPNLPCDVELIS